MRKVPSLCQSLGGNFRDVSPANRDASVVPAVGLDPGDDGDVIVPAAEPAIDSAGAATAVGSADAAGHDDSDGSLAFDHEHHAQCAAHDPDGPSYDSLACCRSNRRFHRLWAIHSGGQ